MARTQTTTSAPSARASSQQKYRQMILFFHHLVILAVCVIAAPQDPASHGGHRIVSKLTKHIPSKQAFDLLAHDQARVQALSKAHLGSVTPSSQVNEPLDNQEFIYTTPVTIGDNPAICMPLTWLGAKEPYHKSPNGVETDDEVYVSYGSQSFEGTLAYDSLNLAEGLVVNNQSIGIAKKVQGFVALDGVIGLGPTGTLSSGNDSSIPTVLDTLYDQGTISSKVFGIGFQPTDPSHVQNGEITWGGIDESRINGSVHYVNITSSSPANQYWGIEQSISYGNVSILNQTAGIIDSGVRLTLLSPDAYNAYKAAMGWQMDWRTGLLRLDAQLFPQLQSLNFNIDGVTYEFTPNAQIWPREINWFIGGNMNYVYSIIGSMGDSADPGIAFVLGYTFLERFYTVYNVDNGSIGIAQTPYTYAESN